MSRDRVRRDTVLFTALGALFLATFAAFAFGYGPTFTTDALAHAKMADALARLDFNPWRYLREAQGLADIGHPVLVPFYLSYAYVFAIVQRLFGERWIEGLVAINAVAQTLTSLLVVAAVRRTSGHPLALLGAVAFLLGTFEFYQWVATTQADTTFVALTTTAVLGALMGRLAGRRRHAVAWLSVAAVAAVLAIFARPAWPPVVIGFALACALPAITQWVTRHAARGAWIAIGASALAALLLLGVSAAVYAHSQALPSGILRDVVQFYRGDLEEGVVVFDRPETYLAPATSALEFLRIMLLRLIYLFWLTSESFSGRHVALNLVTHVPLYGLAVVGTIFALRHGTPVRRALVLILLGWIVATATYHAATVLDYDWRYRAPLYPAFILLASFALEAAALAVTRVRTRAGTAPASLWKVRSDE